MFQEEKKIQKNVQCLTKMIRKVKVIDIMICTKSLTVTTWSPKLEEA